MPKRPKYAAVAAARKLAHKQTSILREALKDKSMPFDPVRDITEFHKKFGLAYTGKPRFLDPKEESPFRIEFMKEELAEYEDFTPNVQLPSKNAAIEFALEKQLDALVDLVYVALGTAHLHGFDFKEAWRRVHKANMKKVRAKSAKESKRGSKLDVIKPAGWKAPTHKDLVANHAHME